MSRTLREYQVEFAREMRERLPVIRKTLGLSEREAADAAGVTLKTYRKWEKAGYIRGINPPRNLCDEFGVCLNWLIMGEGNSSPNANLVRWGPAKGLLTDAGRPVVASEIVKH